MVVVHTPRFITYFVSILPFQGHVFTSCSSYMVFAGICITSNLYIDYKNLILMTKKPFQNRQSCHCRSLYFYPLREMPRYAMLLYLA